KRGDGAYKISGSYTSDGSDMNSNQFDMIKKILEATVENSDQLYEEYIKGYKTMFGDKTNDPQAVAKRRKWAQENTSNEDSVEKWKVLGNIKYKFELERGLAMYYKAK